MSRVSHRRWRRAISTAGTLFAAKAVSRKGVAHPLEPFERVLRVNVLGSFNVARLAAQRMAQRAPDEDNGERGVIVNTASIAAFDGQAGQCSCRPPPSNHGTSQSLIRTSL